MSTCKGTNICEFAEHSFIHKSIYDMICVFLSMYLHIETGLQSVSTCQGRGICEFAEHMPHIQRYL